MALAINGGEPVRTEHFPPHITVGAEEKAALCRVIDSGVLSSFLGYWHDGFLGGPEVRALEDEWAQYFEVKHAVAVNSCSSGLHCAVGAIGTEPGEEIIVSPYSMCVSATAPLVFNAIPVFADIEQDCFCLDPASVEARITPRTRGIIVVDIFGQPYDADAINALARKYGLYVIEDAAQAPGALYRGKFAGTLGDIGVYSLNYHKHIQCGEGGIVVTNDDELAERVRLIRNHAEAVVEGMGRTDLVNMIGFNFRMTELEAAVARCQLQKLKRLLTERQEKCDYMARGLGVIPALTPPEVREGATHAYYLHVFKFDERVAGVSRDRYIDAVRAELPVNQLRETEGVRVVSGYVRPLYLQPLFQQRIAFGSKGFPFSLLDSEDEVDYGAGTCPTCERMYENELFYHEFMKPGLSEKDMDDVICAFEKVWEHRGEILG